MNNKIKNLGNIIDKVSSKHENINLLISTQIDKAVDFEIANEIPHPIDSDNYSFDLFEDLFICKKPSSNYIKVIGDNEICEYFQEKYNKCFNNFFIDVNKSILYENSKFTYKTVDYILNKENYNMEPNEVLKKYTVKEIINDQNNNVYYIVDEEILKNFKVDININNI